MMLKGGKVELRAWQEEDVATMKTIRNDVRLQETLMSEARPNSIERTRQWLSEKTQHPDTLFFVIASTDKNQPIGFVQVTDINRRSGWGYLGICLIPSQQAKGLGSEVLNLLENYLIQVTGLRKLLLYVVGNNTPAIKLYKKYGFKEVGVLKAHYKHSAGYQDVILMEHLLASG